MAEETFIGLRRALAKLFSRELADRPLEDIINGSIAKKRAKFKLSHEDIQTFCIGIGDNNPIHRSGRYAKLILGDQIEKETIVAPGTQLTALAEAYIDDAIEAMQDAWGVILNFTGLNIKFKDWVFPDEPVYWQVLGYRETSRGTNLKIGGLRRVGKDETPKIVIEAMLAKDNNGRSMTQAGPLWTNHYFITNEKLRFFYPSVGETIAPMIPWSYPISFVTSSLLDKSMDNDGVPTGINREMQFDFYKKPDLGKISVDFFSAEEPKELRGGLGFKYTFNTTISQNHEPLISGQVVALSKKQIVY
ncbi:MAG: MaoC family dehydratase [Candidatus Woesearchaeota archaeon]